jgi:hypothetical protein
VFKSLPPLQDILLEHEVHRALMRSHQRRFVMNKLHVWSGVACVSVFLATGALGEILGVQPGTSDNPKDNVPQEIQRSTPGGGSFGPGGTGPGTRSDALTGGMEKEKPESVTRRGLEKNAETGGWSGARRRRPQGNEPEQIYERHEAHAPWDPRRSNPRERRTEDKSADVSAAEF